MGRLVRSNKERVKRQINEKLEVGLEFVAIRARELAEEAMSRQYPPASKPGEYPARRTGQLVDSLRHGFDPVTRRAFVGVSTTEPQYEPNKHAGGIHLVWLMAAGRLGLADVVTSNMSELQSAFREGAESVT